MGSSRWLLLFYPTLIHLLVLAIGEQIPQLYVCNNNGNFTINSTYHSNLNSILSPFSSSNTEIKNGFYNDSVGQNSGKVNAIALCRGDTKADTCLRCIRNSSLALKKLCPNQKEAITWDDNCMLRYSNRSIFGNMEINPSFVMWNQNNVTQVTEFNQTVNKLLSTLISKAASGDSLRKFATGNESSLSNQTIYGLAQCTPDLSKQNCSDCLTKATGVIPKCCGGRKGARVLTPNCNIRYEVELFYDSGPEARPPAPTPMLSPRSPPPPPPPLPLAPTSSAPSPAPTPTPSAPAPTPTPLTPTSSAPPPAPTPRPSAPPPAPPTTNTPSLAPPAPETPTGTASLIGKEKSITGGAFMAIVLLMLF